MKQLKIASFIFSALLFSIAGCLKERDMNIDPDKGQRNVIEFENTGDNIAGATSKFPEFYSDFGLLTSSSTGSSFNVNVSYSGADVARCGDRNDGRHDCPVHASRQTRSHQQDQGHGI